MYFDDDQIKDRFQISLGLFSHSLFVLYFSMSRFSCSELGGADGQARKHRYLHSPCWSHCQVNFELDSNRVAYSSQIMVSICFLNTLNLNLPSVKIYLSLTSLIRNWPLLFVGLRKLLYTSNSSRLLQMILFINNFSMGKILSTFSKALNLFHLYVKYEVVNKFEP